MMDHSECERVHGGSVALLTTGGGPTAAATGEAGLLMLEGYSYSEVTGRWCLDTGYLAVYTCLQ